MSLVNFDGVSDVSPRKEKWSFTLLGQPTVEVSGWWCLPEAGYVERPMRVSHEQVSTK